VPTAGHVEGFPRWSPGLLVIMIGGAVIGGSVMSEGASATRRAMAAAASIVAVATGTARHTGAIADLPASPMVLYEWYPPGEHDKTIIVSDETLTAPPVRIVPETDGEEIHANWSHDGSMLTWEVLRGDDTATVWTANADGSDPKVAAACLADPCVEMSYPSFAAGDERLLVVRYDLDPGGEWGPSHLVLVDLATGEQTVIASTADGAAAFYLPTMSPDGAWVAAALETYTDATENTRTKSEIVVVDTDPATTDAPVAITDPALAAGYPRWHPTDDRILFSSFDLDAFQGAEESQLYTVAPDGSALTQITHVDDGTTARRPGEASWTPDGERIIASVGVVDGGRVVDVKISFIDPVSGEITETAASGAMPTLQPVAVSPGPLAAPVTYSTNVPPPPDRDQMVTHVVFSTMSEALGAGVVFDQECLTGMIAEFGDDDLRALYEHSLDVGSPPPALSSDGMARLGDMMACAE